MNKEKLKEIDINADKEIKRFDNDEALYNKLLLEFIDDLTIRQLKIKIDNGDYKNAYISAHSFKVLVRNLGINTLLLEIKKLVSELSKGEDAVKIKKLYKIVENEYNYDIQVIKESIYQ